jgi:hypothetical protein
MAQREVLWQRSNRDRYELLIVNIVVVVVKEQSFFAGAKAKAMTAKGG